MEDEIREDGAVEETATDEVAEETTEAAPVVEADEEGADDEVEEDGDEDGDDEVAGVAAEVEVAKYRITGLVDYTDEQGNIVGQLPIGSIQELPVSVGTEAVADGRAEAVGPEDVE